MARSRIANRGPNRAGGGMPKMFLLLPQRAPSPVREPKSLRWPADVYALIAAMTSPRPQGELTVGRLCVLAGGQRRWLLPPLACLCAASRRDHGTRLIQRVTLANRRYGCRRIAAQLHRRGLGGK